MGLADRVDEILRRLAILSEIESPDRPTKRVFGSSRRPKSLENALRQKREFAEPIQSDLACPDLNRKISVFPKIRNRAYLCVIPLRQEGRTRRHERGAGCDGRDGAD